MKTKLINILFFLCFCESALGQIPGTPNLLSTRPNPTSNGYAIISGYSCSTASAGNMQVGVAVSGVTQTITATVTKAGTYNIAAINNGVTFAASGTFTTTGTQDILLNASGTPTVGGSNNFTLNTTPNCSFSRIIFYPSTNGTANVSGYICSTASQGTLTAGVAVSGVTQTITAQVTTIGTYNISTVANGVTFAASGTFITIGTQDIVLTASGTPTAAGTNNFTLNTSPNCLFSRTTYQPAIISGYNCSTASAGVLIVGVAASGVTQTITATVTTAGTYNISTSTVNGITFAASGILASTGSQNIVLTASGTPTTIGVNSFTLNTTPNCSFSRYTSITGCYARTATSPDVYKDFLCRNLGVTGSQDYLTYQSGNNNGDLYQWGRQTDGHEVRTSATQAGPVSAPVANKIITNNNTTKDWITPQNNTRWDNTKTANDPCPAGYKVPSINQWGSIYRESDYTITSPSQANRNTWTWTGNGFLVGTTLYLPAAGLRSADLSTASLGQVGTGGYYWSSTFESFYSLRLSFSSTIVNAVGQVVRVAGQSIRCIAE